MSSDFSVLIKCYINIGFWYYYYFIFLVRPVETQGSDFPIKKIPIVVQNNIALIPMVNVSISRYFSITVSALIVEEILGEEPGLSALITCIMARRQNWHLNNTSWVTPSHKWSCDLYSRNTNPEQLLCASTGEQWRGFPNDHL